MRLDAVLAFALPALGARGRRRLWEWCRVTVNGRNRPPGFCVTQGDVVRLEAVAAASGPGVGKGCAQTPFPQGEEAGAQSPGGSGPMPRLVAVSADFIALRKPCGLHTAHIAGGRDASLESMLVGDWEQLWSECGEPMDFPGGKPVSSPILLTRLDEATSGIVLAARSGEAAERFRLAERQGLVEKYYFAVLQGRLEYSLELGSALATDNRKITVVLDEKEPDTTRHTLVTPLNQADSVPAAGAGEEVGERGSTLALVRIKRGARHQIRAHLAGAGFPLVGEWLYPHSTTRKKGVRLYLHHARVDFPGFSAEDMPGWGLGERFPQGLFTL